MAEKVIRDLYDEVGIVKPKLLEHCPLKLREKSRVNIFALGDVGTTVLIGLRLMGGDVISSIGIYDINNANLQRLEMEMNQIRVPFEGDENSMPQVSVIAEEELFDCDVLVFCASKGVPGIGVEGDVRMAQLEANKEIISNCGDLAKAAGFQGMVCVVSDPVDPLCKALLQSSGLDPAQIQGYGLGVMNARALYYAGHDNRFVAYATKGRAFGPHGHDLVIADNVENYDDSLSRELTALAIDANMKVRDLGYKPYIAPALSSAAISILMTMRGQWHYSSLYFGDGTSGAFLGMKNIMTQTGPEYENIKLDEKLFKRIRKAYINLCVL
ncbi:lactate/malate family dehydrogenase [Aminicella lysinilytica]|uniref:Malate/lactate dehydrogenase n=1 Tax=Aminicella lysinilytica TaxID=433323 RepID=A0A4R6Q5I5_9FIRM|nr:lactate dehydrogenase [Aminicella lysinilytica]TDP57648.1 malate/lactate dehydrogenase [Aminicella lysinilytica]